MVRQNGLTASGHKDNWNPEASQNEHTGSWPLMFYLKSWHYFFFCYIFFYWAGAPALFANYTCQHKWQNEVPFVYDLLAFQRTQG